MAALLAELEKATRRNSRWRWALAGAAIAAVGVSFFWYLSTGRTEAADPCARAGSEIVRAWNPQRQKTLEQAFRSDALADAWPAINKILSERAKDWREASATACRAKDTQSERLQEHTARCLALARQRFSELVSELEHLPGRLAPDALQSTLYDPAICHEGIEIADRAQPPSADLEVALADVEVQLARGDAQRILGRYSKAINLARKQAKRAREMGCQPLFIEAQRLLGSSLLYSEPLRERTEGVAILKRALVLSQEVGDDRSTLEILNHLIANAIMHDRNSSHGKRWVEMTRTIIERIEAGPQVRAALARNRGLLAFKDGDYTMAVEHHRSALVDADRAREFPNELRALHHRDLGGAVRRYCINQDPPYPKAYYGNSRAECLDRAEAEYQASLKYYHAADAGDDPQVAETQFGLAILARDRQLLDTARELLKGVLSTHERGLGEDHSLLGKVYWNLAVVESEMKRYDQAWKHVGEARRIFEKNRDIHLADAINTQGVIAFFREGPAVALVYYEEARILLKKQSFDDNRVLGKTLANITEAHLELAKAARRTDPARARKHIQKAREAFDATMTIQPRTDELEKFIEKTLQPTLDKLNRLNNASYKEVTRDQ